MCQRGIKHKAAQLALILDESRGKYRNEVLLEFTIVFRRNDDFEGAVGTAMDIGATVLKVGFTKVEDFFPHDVLEISLARRWALSPLQTVGSAVLISRTRLVFQLR